MKFDVVIETNEHKIKKYYISIKKVDLERIYNSTRYIDKKTIKELLNTDTDIIKIKLPVFQTIVENIIGYADISAINPITDLDIEYKDDYLNKLNAYIKKYDRKVDFSNTNFISFNRFVEQKEFIDKILSSKIYEDNPLFEEIFTNAINLLEVTNLLYKKRDLLKGVNARLDSLSYFLSKEEVSNYKKEIDKYLDVIPTDYSKIISMINVMDELIKADWNKKLTDPADFTLGSDYKFLCHTTSSYKWDGEFYSNYVSTSLLTPNLIDTYRLPYGFIFPMDNITSASSKDTMTVNNAENDDDLFFYTSVLMLESCDEIIDKCLKLKKDVRNRIYSEIVIKGFNPTYLFCYSDGSKEFSDNYRSIKRIQESFPDLKIIDIDRTFYVDEEKLKQMKIKLFTILGKKYTNTEFEASDAYFEYYNDIWDKFMQDKKNNKYDSSILYAEFISRYDLLSIRTDINNNLFESTYTKDEIKCKLDYSYMDRIFNNENLNITNIFNMLRDLEQYKNNKILNELYPGIEEFINLFNNIDKDFLFEILENIKPRNFVTMSLAIKEYNKEIRNKKNNNLSIKNIQRDKKQLEKEEIIAKIVSYNKANKIDELGYYYSLAKLDIDQIQDDINVSESIIKECDLDIKSANEEYKKEEDKINKSKILKIAKKKKKAKLLNKLDFVIKLITEDKQQEEKHITTNKSLLRGLYKDFFDKTNILFENFKEELENSIKIINSTDIIQLEIELWEIERALDELNTEIDTLNTEIGKDNYDDTSRHK